MLSVLIVTSDQSFENDVKSSLSRCKEVDPKEIETITLSPKIDELQGFRKAEEDIARILRDKDVVHDRFVGILQVNANCVGNIPSRSCQGGLILAFPEIQWIPIYGLWQDECNEKDGCMTWRHAVKLCRNGYSPLFDGDGLRSCLMLRVHQDGTSYARANVALAVDEETHFTQMNAYTAYRFGYRAYPVPSKTVADELLRGSALDLPKVTTLMETDLGLLKEFKNRLSTPTTIVFEDVQLQFPDDKDDKGGNVPVFGSPRDEKYPLLRKANLRVIATASQREEKIANNGSHGNTTVEHYFHNKPNGLGGQYISLKGVGWRQQVERWLQWERERLSRWWFNASGDWAGYWLVNMVNALLTAIVSFGMFFWNESLLLPVLFGLFIFKVFLRWGFQTASARRGWLPEWLRLFWVRRWQWRFLPKRYYNHCPLNQIWKRKDTYWTITHKPLAGIFGLRNECCLPNGQGFQGLYDSPRIWSQYQSAKRGDFGTYNEENVSHAAPGMQMEIAVRLLRRVEQLKVEGKIIDVEGAVHCAVLATVAGELLDAKTPTVSIEALTWKQYFEIRAECEFIGVQAHPDMADRYIDIHNAMRRICRTSDGTVRENVYNSGMAELMDKLSELLSENGKREEALFFEKKARMFHRRLMSPLARNLLFYPEWLLRSALHVVIGLVILMSVFCAFWMIRVKPDLCTAFSKAYEILFCDEPIFTEEYSIVLRSMRLVTMLHLAFLGLCFWDVMRKK